jgi:hypothetical protein
MDKKSKTSSLASSLRVFAAKIFSGHEKIALGQYLEGVAEMTFPDANFADACLSLLM